MNYQEHRTKIQESVEKYIPDHMVDGVVQYVCLGRIQGGFLMAIFENNLVNAACRADHTNLHCLVDYAPA